MLKSVGSNPLPRYGTILHFSEYETPRFGMAEARLAESGWRSQSYATQHNDLTNTASAAAGPHRTTVTLGAKATSPQIRENIA